MGTTNQLRTASRQKQGRTVSALARRASKASPTDTNHILAALLYEHMGNPILANLGIDQHYELVGGRILQGSTVKSFKTVFLASPQVRYTGPGQCELILQSKAVEGVKELLTGLRPVALPPLPGMADVKRVLVGDYKLDRHKQAPAPTAVVIVGKSLPDETGWMLLLVVDRRYNRRSRVANEQTARDAVRKALPYLPEFLAQLTPQAS